MKIAFAILIAAFATSTASAHKEIGRVTHVSAQVRNLLVAQGEDVARFESVSRLFSGKASFGPEIYLLVYRAGENSELLCEVRAQLNTSTNEIMGLSAVACGGEI